ncbi:MAG: hypothetical protein RLZZ129_1543 [Verrucomicrobiota bacterium]|jgi:YhcH/YjgK/YiaL family protein
MIFDMLDHAGAYHQIGSRFAAALKYLRTFDPATPDGKIVIEDDNVFAVVQSYTPTPAGERPYEAHRGYADIQYVVSGEEIIYYAPLVELRETAAYTESGDYALYTGEDKFPLLMPAGCFAILWPQDGHKPGCLWRIPAPVKKVVMKVRL